MSKKLELNEPTRRTIETLFRELTTSHYRDSIYSELSDQLDELEKKILRSHKGYQTLKRKKNEAYSKYYASDRKIRVKVRSVRMQYLAKGLTPEVRKQLEQLIKEHNSAYDMD